MTLDGVLLERLVPELEEDLDAGTVRYEIPLPSAPPAPFDITQTIDCWFTSDASPDARYQFVISAKSGDNFPTTVRVPSLNPGPSQPGVSRGIGAPLRIVAALVVVLLTPVYARAQDASVVLSKQIGDLAGSATGDESMVANIRDSLWQVVYLKRDELVSSGQADIAEILTFRRADVQTGSGSGASGTTSAVMDPLLPAIFGMGFENGAITRSVSGSTISIKVAPAGLICAARPLKAAAVARRDDEGCKTFWRRFGVVASFDTTRGEKSKKLDSLQTLDNQFAGVSVRAEVINLRKATGARYRETFATKYDAWKEAATELVDLDLTTPSLEAAQKVVEDQLLALTRKPEWKGLTPEQRKTQILAIVNQALKPVRVPEAKAATVRNVWLRSLRADRELENAVANAPCPHGRVLVRPARSGDRTHWRRRAGRRPAAESAHHPRDLRPGPGPHESRLHGQRFGIVVQRGSSGHVRAVP